MLSGDILAGGYSHQDDKLLPLFKDLRKSMSANCVTAQLQFSLNQVRNSRKAAASRSSELPVVDATRQHKIDWN